MQDVSWSTLDLSTLPESKLIYNVEKMGVEAKKLKEHNEDCSDLDYPDEKCGDENGLIYLCEKLDGKLQSLGSETRAKIRDRRAALDSAEANFPPSFSHK